MSMLIEYGVISGFICDLVCAKTFIKSVKILSVFPNVGNVLTL